MGIRILHRRTAPARTQAQAHADKAPSPARHPVPLHAATASTARIPVDPVILLRRAQARARAAGPRIPARLATTLRHATADLRHRLTRHDEDAVEEAESAQASGSRLWAELALGYLALALALLPRSRPMSTMTVFVAAAGTVSGRPEEPSLPGRRAPAPEPGATA
ncbi:hypothetical protein OHT57_13100 [Streptomyces sp. NBC_00285]|uniref:hypothetical protein n=1 Tax=Streptomyces sp. NBC_00285 TaxID=2975700 RepID=UPI002E2BED13|nr:hypothetical protein [Streptomyces sp. NBC_00285]